MDDVNARIGADEVEFVAVFVHEAGVLRSDEANRGIRGAHAHACQYRDSGDESPCVHV
jgi:hypothetical protein